MTTVLDLVRGLGLYLWIFAAALGYGWLLLPHSDNGRMLVSVVGGGAILVLMVIVGLGTLIQSGK